MANMCGKTDKVTEGLAGLEDSFGCGSVVLIVNLLVESEDRDHADIRELLMQSEIGRVVIEEGRRHAVEDKRTIMATEGPEFRRCIGTVHDTVDDLFKFLPATFSIILVLIMWFTLPILNDEGTEDVLYAVADFDRGGVADELVHGSPIADLIFKSVDELIRGMPHVVKRDHEGDTANEKLEACNTANGRNIATDSIRGDSLMATTDIAGRKRRAVTVTQGMAELRCTPGILGSVSVCLRNEGGCNPKEERTQGGEIMFLRGDSRGTVTDMVEDG
jgi:hypothetical protein